MRRRELGAFPGDDHFGAQQRREQREPTLRPRVQLGILAKVIAQFGGETAAVLDDPRAQREIIAEGLERRRLAVDAARPRVAQVL